MKLRYAMAAAALIACGMAHAARADVDWGYLSANLRENMTEQEVMNAIGYRPNKVEQNVCGAQTPHSWDCKIYTFGYCMFPITAGCLTVYFYRDDEEGIWRVNSWNVEP